MINKRTFLLITLSLVLLAGGIFIVITQRTSRKIGAFKLIDYQYYIENFASEENVGSIANSKDAIRKAEAIWIKLYGDSIKKEKPYQLFYDSENGVWLIRGTLKSNKKGGVASILIEGSTGNVLAVWHDK